MRTRRSLPLAAVLLTVGLATASPAIAADPPTRLSTDPYTTGGSNHATEVEPDSFAFGGTVVAAFQVGRFVDGGASNVGWAVSTDSGTSWTGNKFLTGLTTAAAGTYARASDPSVAYDAKHGVWLIASLALDDQTTGAAVVVNRSSNGAASFGAAVAVATAQGTSDFDKEWVVCDNTPSSPHYGNCYVQWDDYGNGGVVKMSTSTDGGAVWGAAADTTDQATGLGGQPVVQPNGTVVVPLADANENSILAFRSTDGGATWGPTATVAPVSHAGPASDPIRAGPLPSAEIDGAGRVYVAWEDCRFRGGGCPFSGPNDIVMSSSADGVTWSPVSRVPIDPVTSGVDHIVPGLGVDPSTSGATARLALAYHYLPDGVCASVSSCTIDVGLICSGDGGQDWGAPLTLAGPMTASWLAPTNQGYMFGDYISTSFATGSPHAAFALAHAPVGSTYDEAIYSAPDSSVRLDCPTRPASQPPEKPPISKPPSPALSVLRIAPKRFRAARHGTSIARALGAVVTYRSAVTGQTTFAVERSVRRNGHLRWQRVSGSFARAALAGGNRFRFTGRLRGRLRPALYRLTAVPHDAAGKAGPGKTARFRVLRASARSRVRASSLAALPRR